MRQVNAGVAKSNSCVGSSQHHLAACLIIGSIFEGPGEELSHYSQCFERPYVADGIRALVCRAQDGSVRPGTLIEPDRRVGFNRVAQDIQAAAAATSGGIVRVFSGSTIPRVGLSLRCAIPVFA